MPYIITSYDSSRVVYNGETGISEYEAEGRRAVATLDEANEALYAIVKERYASCRVGVPEAGGSIGPLPDGTVIAVKATTTTEIEISLGCTDAQMGQMSDAEAVKAFNDKERTK